jgi:hypothetical protein
MQWIQEHWPTIESYLVHAAASIFSALTAVGITYRFFGEKLIGNFFDRRLEAFKHEQTVELGAIRHDQNQQIENLKAQISHITDRGIRSNEREYTALASIWEKYVDLHYATNVCVVGFTQFPELNNYSDEELANYLETTEFSKMQKEQVKKATDKIRSAATIQNFRYVNAAQTQFYEMNLLLHKLGIFVPIDIRNQFRSPIQVCGSAMAQRYAELGGRRIQMEADLEFLRDGDKHLHTLKTIVGARLLRDLRA